MWLATWASKSWMRGEFLAPVLATFPLRVRLAALWWRVCSRVLHRAGAVIGYGPYKAAWARSVTIRTLVEREENRLEIARFRAR